jgi:hypothetical protein
MEDRQRKLSKNIGKDTHTRNIGSNMFQTQAVETFKIISGEVFLPQPEPLFTQTAVTVNLTKGGTLSGVGYPGAFIEPMSGNLHGSYEGPIPGQMVMIGFAEGNSSAPFVINRYPYQGVGNSLTQPMYVNPLTRSLYNSQDVAIGHYLGSYLCFNTGFPIAGMLPGSTSLHSTTDLIIDAGTKIDMSCLTEFSLATQGAMSIAGLTVDSTATAANTINGLTVELNGNTKSFVTWTELNTALQLLIIALSVPAIVAGTCAVGPVTGTATYTPPPTLDISAAMTTTVLTGG